MKSRFACLAVSVFLSISFGVQASLEVVENQWEKIDDTSRIVTLGGTITDIVYALGAGDQVVGVETADRRFTWCGVSLSAAFGDAGSPELILPLFDSFGVRSPFELNGDRLIAMRRHSKLGGWLVFLFNLTLKRAQTEVKPEWQIIGATDLLEETPLKLSDRGFSASVEPGGVRVIHCCHPPP